MRLCNTLVSLLLIGGAIGLSTSDASAEPAPATAEIGPRPTATSDVREGDRALAHHEFRDAAESYERAYRRSGSLGALLKAAHSRVQAGELARAANLYTEYLASAPPNAAPRAKASKALKKLTARVGRIEVSAVDVDHVTLDGAPLDKNSSYVMAGAHAVEGQTKDQRSVRVSSTVAAGESATVSLAPPVEAAPAPPVVAAKPGPAPSSQAPLLANTQTSKHGWSPAVVVVGGAVTAGLLGLSIWSGLDTVAFKDKFDKEQTRDNLDKGNSKQLRTNVLIGGTAGAAALTTVVAVFLVDWKGAKKESPPAPSMQVGLGPSSAYVTGTF